MNIYISGGVANQPNVKILNCGRGISYGWFEVSLTQKQRVVTPAFSGIIAVNDALVNRVTDGVYALDQEILVDKGFRTPDFEVTKSLSAGSGFTLDGNIAKSIANNITQNLIFSAPNRTFSISITSFIGNIGSSIDNFSNWVSGSLAKSASDSIDVNISGKTANSTTLNQFSSYNHGSASYIRNSSCWASPWVSSLTAIIDYNSRSSGYPGDFAAAGSLITPRHVLGAAHYGPWLVVGQILRFVGPTGVVYDRTVIARKTVGATDIEIGLLDSSLPAEIFPVLIPPVLFENYLKSPKYGVPCLYKNQFGEIRVIELSNLYSNGEISSSTFSTSASTEKRREFIREPVGGDSGGPVMMVVNGRLMLMMSFYFATSGPGYWKTNWASEIPALDSLAGINTGLQPTRADLSSFNNYP